VTALLARRGGRARAYARLAKLDIVDYYLGLLVVWTLLPPAARLDGSVLRVLGLFLLGEVLVVAAMVALDDVTGYRDGSDAANYGPDVPARKRARKPLLSGALTEAEALRFALLVAVAGALAWAAAVLLAPHRPGWAVALVAATFVLSLQYSWGWKLSYRGFQELFLAALGWALVLGPYGLLAGRAGAFAVVQALLFGLGPLLFGVYSNTNDIAGDRRVGRLTVACLASPRGNALFIGAVSLAETALIVGAPAAGLVPWWFPLAMLPTVALRIGQYHVGFGRRDILRARKLGIWTHRCTVVLLVGLNLAWAGVG
jgi:1,4-dihydroxy-2-naphthoate octaprenyltransferase